MQCMSFEIRGVGRKSLFVSNTPKPALFIISLVHRSKDRIPGTKAGSGMLNLAPMNAGTPDISTGTMIFSICTIVTDHGEYAAMKNSFTNAGFVDNCEYLFVDNSEGNQLDAYQSITKFIDESNGRYCVV